MKILGSYVNGNYKVTILDDGTKIKDNGNASEFIAEKPESMDIKITNKCNQGCKFCHENSLPNGEQGTILNVKFLDTLLPYTELAIGGGNPLEHPDLYEFLTLCKSKNLICNMTVNQVHFEQNYELLVKLCQNKLIYGLGVSLVNVSDNFLEMISKLPNAVIHLINGVHSLEDIKKLYDKNLKILILGYKDFRRGLNYDNGEAKITITRLKSELYSELEEMLKHFNAVSFDNLALKQLDVKRLLSDVEWNEFYMGDDGTHTMFVDLVKNTFSVSSTTPENKRHELLDNITDMFNIIKCDVKKGIH